jgi:hypothetical protein
MRLGGRCPIGLILSLSKVEAVLTGSNAPAQIRPNEMWRPKNLCEPSQPTTQNPL